jgi:predicted dehydrogenase
MLNGEYVFGWSPPPDHWLWDPENGNGFFNENSGHLFDAVCYLLGKPVSVMAEAANFNQHPSEDAAAVSIRFASGAIAALTIGGLGATAHQDFPRIDVTTQHGQARLRGKHHMWESLTWATHTDKETRTFTELPEVLGTTRYTRAMQHFFACIRSRQPPTATIEDGITAVALAEAVYKSAHSGRKVLVDI